MFCPLNWLSPRKLGHRIFPWPNLKRCFMTFLSRSLFFCDFATRKYADGLLSIDVGTINRCPFSVVYWGKDDRGDLLRGRSFFSFGYRTVFSQHFSLEKICWVNKFQTFFRFFFSGKKFFQKKVAYHLALKTLGEYFQLGLSKNYKDQEWNFSEFFYQNIFLEKNKQFKHKKM